MIEVEEQIPWIEIEAIIRRDLTNRGLVNYRHNGELLGFGQLELAVKHLAKHAHHVAIVTGFCIADATKPAAETDGPPGAIYLANALIQLGIEVTLISDQYGIPLLEVGCDFFEISRDLILEFPIKEPKSFDIDSYFQDSVGNTISHLIAIERVGPSHTSESIQQNEIGDGSKMSLFEQLVPIEVRDSCRNKRGVDIGNYTAATHLLFEHIQKKQLLICTIGIGDGGNEIGMGSFPWSVLRKAVEGDDTGQSICRITTDYSPIAGVSNWAAYAMALTLCWEKKQHELAITWDIDRQSQLIRHIVEQTGALDGVTKQSVAQVDGLNMETYLQQLGDLRILLGYKP